jgi:hypothetical protein
LVVPFSIPKISSTWLDTKVSFKTFMRGIPPPTAPSKRIVVLFSFASLEISLPYSARRCLFAVTTGFPSFRAVSTTSFATSTPPISSTTISELLTTSFQSVVLTFSGTSKKRFLFQFLAATLEISISTPLFFLSSSLFFKRISTTPVPTSMKALCRARASSGVTSIVSKMASILSLRSREGSLVRGEG